MRREESCIYAKTIAWDRFHLVGCANAEIGEKAGMFCSTMHSVNTHKWNLVWPTRCSSFVDATPEENSDILKMMMKTRIMVKTLPKALRTQALTPLTSNFGLIGLVHYAW